MNIYDFDKTIFDGDSTASFYWRMLRKYPKLARHWGRQARGFLSYFRNKMTKTQAKEIFYTFLNDIEDVDAEVEEFWDANMHRVKSWYLAQKRTDDVIISASPQFLLRPAMERLGGLYLIASRVDPKTGKTMGENCHGAEKVRRFYLEFPKDARVEKFYSDSYSDTPLARIAEEAYLVKGDRIVPWNEKYLK